GRQSGTQAWPSWAVRLPAGSLKGVRVRDFVIRSAELPDLDASVPLAGSRDRALVRLRAADRQDDAMLVARDPDDVVGVASVRWDNDCDPPHPWLYGLAVAAPARRRGIGGALVAAAEKLCSSYRASCLSLDVDVGDVRAIAFFQRQGYRIVRGHEHRWRSLDPDTGAVTGEGTASTWIMRRRLD
ncbi:MAG: GNAT family N-acetyltransferase, partial [Micromonosporaceae bacterium]